MLVLLHNMLDITNLTLCSDTKIQVEYFSGAFIVNFILQTSANTERLVDVQVLFIALI